MEDGVDERRWIPAICRYIASAVFASEDVFPVGAEISRAGESAAHPDDRNVQGPAPLHRTASDDRARGMAVGPGNGSSSVPSPLV